MLFYIKTISADAFNAVRIWIRIEFIFIVRLKCHFKNIFETGEKQNLRKKILYDLRLRFDYFFGIKIIINV